MHVFLQRVGILIAALAALMGLIMVGSGRRHFMTTHGFYGLIVMVVGMAQPLNAILRPRPAVSRALHLVRRSDEIACHTVVM